ncbi:MAG TPA: nitroreductase [Gammaproteobacteria bacterium]|mgnify:CR=1 FL=1|nr:nitroreductase [Gammaproteobacteria bacterium]
MNALDTLQYRTSSPRLMDPAPTHEQLDHLFKAAVRAADHGLLRPWRFLTIRGQARSLLGELLVSAARQENSDFSAAQAEKLAGKPHRAPLIIVTIASPKPHPKVPEFEQALSAAAATQNMINAAFALGLGAMWRTGAPAYQRIVNQGLGLDENEKIIGFLYLGTKTGAEKPKPDADYSGLVHEWGEVG